MAFVGALKLLQTACIVICFIQVLNIIRFYFRYEVVNSTNIRIPDKESLPSLTFVFKIRDVLSFLSLISSNNGKQATNITNLATHFYSFFATNCVIDLNGENKWVACCELSNVTIRSDGYRLYFTLFDRSGALDAYKDVKFVCNLSPTLMRIKVVDVDELRYCYYFADANFESVDPELCQGADIETGVSISAFMTFHKSTRTRLPLPYTSKCLNYEFVALHSRKHCTDFCVLSQCMEKCGFMAVGVIQRLNENYIEYDNRPCLYIDRLLWKCNKFCGSIDCVQQQYEIQVNIIDLSLTNEKQFMIVNRPFNAIFVDKIEIPANNFVQALVDVAGVVGLWLGISVLSVLTCTVEHFDQFLRLRLRHRNVRCEMLYNRLCSKASIKTSKIFICCILFALLNVEILQTYKERSTAVDIVHYNEFPKKVYMPAITFFLKFIEGDKTKWVNLLTDVANDSRMNITNILANKLISGCSLTNPDGKECFCNHSVISFYFMENTIVLMLYRRRLEELENDEFILSTNSYNLYLRFNNESFRDFSVKYLIHSPITLPTKHDIDSKAEEMPQSYGSMIRFAKYLYFHLLPPPYETNCKKWKHYHSKSHCINSCVIRLSIKLCICFPDNAYADINTILFRKFNRCPCSDFYNIHNNCMIACRNSDCYTSYYSFKVVSSFRSEGVITAHGAPLTTTTGFRLRPRIVEIDLLLFIQGSISICFGLPVIYVNHLLHILIRKCNRNFEIQQRIAVSARSFPHLKWVVKNFVKLAVPVICVTTSLYQFTNIMVAYNKMHALVNIEECHGCLIQGNLPVLHFSEYIPFVFQGDDLQNIIRLAERSNILEAVLVYVYVTRIKNCRICADMNCEIQSKFYPNVSIVKNDFLVSIEISDKDINISRSDDSHKHLISFQSDPFCSFRLIPQRLTVTPKYSRSSVLKNKMLYVGSFSSFTFSKVSVELLPHPFPSDCQNYTLINFLSQEDCSEKCYTELSKSICESVAISALFNRYSPRNLRDNSDCVWEHKILKKCQNFCKKQDCVKEYYTPQTLHEFKGNYKNNYRNVHIFFPPSKMITKFKLVPQMTEFDLLIYIANMISMWFGFSVNMAINFTLDINLNNAAALLISIIYNLYAHIAYTITITNYNLSYLLHHILRSLRRSISTP